LEQKFDAHQFETLFKKWIDRTNMCVGMPKSISDYFRETEGAKLEKEIIKEKTVCK
jgi:hypothetical protein